MPSSFDRLFNNLPEIALEKDYDRFWDRSESELKRVPMDIHTKQSSKHSTRFNIFELSFRSAGKTQITGTLHIPKAVNRPHPVIIIHDYNHPEPYKGYHLDDGLAYFFMHLRGHEGLKEPEQEEKPRQGQTRKKQREFPGFLQEGILSHEDFYARNICLDALRSIDVLRLNRSIDCGSIAIMGRGFGALPALFAASRSNRVKALVIDSPLFSWIEESQNKSESDAAFEINEYLHHHYTKKGTVKKVLSYFDIIPIAQYIECPVMMVVGLKDKISPPHCSLALFNHLLCDKEAQIYPDDGNDAGGEKQFRKASSWILDTFTL